MKIFFEELEHGEAFAIASDQLQQMSHHEQMEMTKLLCPELGQFYRTAREVFGNFVGLAFYNTLTIIILMLRNSERVSAEQDKTMSVLNDHAWVAHECNEVRHLGPLYYEKMESIATICLHQFTSDAVRISKEFPSGQTEGAVQGILLTLELIRRAYQSSHS